MGKLNLTNLKKAYYYMKRNGLRDTYLAALERLRINPEMVYAYTPPDARTLEAQRSRTWKETVRFSILVPAYHTPETYMKAMIQSVLDQTYPGWELLIADASRDSGVREVVHAFDDERIRYLPLSSNEGISENTNAALAHAEGEYIALLDHDDLLTCDALYQMAVQIEKMSNNNKTAAILYSDEDKCDENGATYYEPHHKREFNLDLILSNNYICHFLAMRTELAREVGFRREYDGAQDFDFVLRAAARVSGEEIIHIPRVLYHWRCHRQSTAFNPESKRYAYEAGGRAIADYAAQAGWKARVVPLKHLGFYRLEYIDGIMTSRKEIGLVGGKIIGSGNKITGGIYNTDGNCIYEGLHRSFSGYMHRASLQQQAEIVDIRLMKVNPAVRKLFLSVLGYAYQGMPGEEDRFDYRVLPKGTDYMEASRAVCNAVRREGFGIMWEPEWIDRKSVV